MLEIRLSKDSLKVLEKLQKSDLATAKRIVDKLDQLAADSSSLKAKTLTGYSPMKRMRVGDYRVVFEAKETELLVFIIDIRSKIYKKLAQKLRTHSFD